MVYGGGSIKKNGIYGQVTKALEGFEVTEFPGIEANPHYEPCMKAVEVVKEKKIAFAFAFALFVSPCIKKDTVIGIIGKTQGITTAAKPATKAPQKNIHKDSSLVESLEESVAAAAFTTSIVSISLVLIPATEEPNRVVGSPLASWSLDTFTTSSNTSYNFYQIIRIIKSSYFI